ncbi:hypothetical protein IKG06_02415 [Candidatus Saccharibacteria bacterium]|nr:hypothetical protein [Candidatus Saccharibacteria bacterium]
MHAFKAIGHETISIGQSKRQKDKKQLSLFINRDIELCYSNVGKTETAVAVFRTPESLYPIVCKRTEGANPSRQFVVALEPDLCVFKMDDDGFSILPTFSDKHVIIDFSKSKSRYQLISCATRTILYVLDLQGNHPSLSRYYLRNDSDYGHRYQQLAHNCGLPKLNHDGVSRQWRMRRTGFVDIKDKLNEQHNEQLLKQDRFVLC